MRNPCILYYRTFCGAKRGDVKWRKCAVCGFRTLQLFLFIEIFSDFIEFNEMNGLENIFITLRPQQRTQNAVTFIAPFTGAYYSIFSHSFVWTALEFFSMNHKPHNLMSINFSWAHFGQWNEHSFTAAASAMRLPRERCVIAEIGLWWCRRDSRGGRLSREEEDEEDEEDHHLTAAQSLKWT